MSRFRTAMRAMDISLSAGGKVSVHQEGLGFLGMNQDVFDKPFSSHEPALPLRVHSYTLPPSLYSSTSPSNLVKHALQTLPSAAALQHS